MMDPGIHKHNAFIVVLIRILRTVKVPFNIKWENENEIEIITFNSFVDGWAKLNFFKSVFKKVNNHQQFCRMT